MDETAQTEQAVIEWIRSFNLPSGGDCASLEELCDGCVIASLLSELVPEHFDRTTVSQAAGNWAVGVSNLKGIVKALEQYYREALGKRVVDLDSLDCKAIARNNDTEELLNLLELVIGVAVLCEHKAAHIQEIFALGQDTQKELQVLIECAMGRVVALEVDAEAEAEAARGAGSSNVGESAAVAELKEERRRLLESLRSMESANTQLEAQVEQLTREAQSRSDEAATAAGAGTGVGWGGAGVDASASAALQQQLFDCRRELDDRTLELESAGAELQNLQALLSTARQMQSKSEVEAQMMADKVELATETQVRLTQAEALLEKYKRRLEELPQLRQENKDNAAKLDEFVERCHNLEGCNAKLTQLLEASNHKNGELEKRCVREELSAQELGAEAAGLRVELEQARAAQKAREAEAKALRAEMAELRAAAEVEIAAAQDNAEVAVQREMSAAHDKQIKRLAAESRSSASASADQQGEALRLLEEELAAVTERKEERERQWLDAKKQLVAAQQELAAQRKSATALQEELSEARLAQAGGAGSEAQELAVQKLAVQLKEAEQQLALQSKTARMYEDRFKEKDALINKLEQEKDELKTFTQRTLNNFKNKFMRSLGEVRDEKRALEAQLEEVIAKYQQNKETAVREERLIMSAMYEIGLRTIDQNISAQLGKHSKSNH